MRPPKKSKRSYLVVNKFKLVLNAAMWFDKEAFWDYKNNLSATFYRKCTSTKKSLIELTSKSKSFKGKSFQTYITEYLLHQHYDLVEKGCYNRSTKIDLLGNWHIFWLRYHQGTYVMLNFLLEKLKFNSQRVNVWMCYD